MQHRQVHPRREIVQRLFVNVQHGANLHNTRPVKVRHRLEAVDAPLEQQRHEKRLHRVVIVMSQRQLVEALVQNCLIQRPPAHFGAHGAGILLLAVVKNNGRDLRFHHGIGHVPLLAQRRDLRIVHPQPHINGDRFQLVGLIKVFPQPRQQNQQGERILPSGHAHGNAVARLDHMIVVHAPPNQSHQLLHSCFSSEIRLK